MLRNLTALRRASHALRSRPRYVLLVALLFAVGIGATVAVFSVMRATLLADTGYRDAGRLVHLWSLQPAVREEPLPLSIPDIDALRAQAGSLHGVVAFRAQTFTLSSFAEPISVQGLRISAGALRTLGLRPGAGRDFIEADTSTGAAPVVVVSAGFCAQHFANREAGSCDVAGESLTIDGIAHEIVGVLPAGQRFPGVHFRSPAPDIWVPLVAAESERSFGRKLFRAIARLAPGASAKSATRELQTVFARLAVEHPQYYEGWSARAQPLAEAIAGRLRTPLYVALLAALLLLATACINAASLTVTRHIGSLPETAVRAALGARPRTLLKEQALENAILAAIGLAGGIAFAFLAVAGFRANASAALGNEVDVRLEWATLLFATFAALVVVAVTTLATWLLIRRLPLAEYLKDGGKGAAGTARRSSALPVVIVVEFAMALALLVVGAGLFAQLARAESTQPGFDVRGAWVATFNLPATSYSDEAAQQRFHETIAREIAAQPGIESASAVARAPMIPGFPSVNFTVEGNPVQPGHQPIAQYRPITHEYFETMRMPLRDGRAFTEADRVQAADVVIVSESLAATQWPGDSAIGRRIQLADERTRWRTIVGVIGDAHLTALDIRPELAVYAPIHQNSWPNLLATACVIFRTQGSAAAALAVARDATRRVDAALPPPQLERLDEAVHGSVAKRAFLSSLIFAFACIAALLALLGVYGAFEYLAATRSGELAIRRALGAGPLHVIRETAQRTALLLACAAILGGVLIVVLLRLAEGFILDWKGSDTAAVAASAAALTLAALVASCVPLRGVIRRPIAVTLRAAH